MGQRIGFVSTRFAGTDGVSLESEKWARVLASLGHEVFWYAGRSDRPAATSLVVPEAFFGHHAVAALQSRLFNARRRSRADTERVFELASHLKQTLYDFVERFEIEQLIIQNALAIPMHVPLGVAITQLVAERALPTIAHHHDFHWERQRFAASACGDLLAMAFPPALPSIRHVVINSQAERDLALRRGVSSTLVPNVLDFDTPPPATDRSALRARLGIGDDEVVLLQPTRVVPRKGIEHAVTLSSLLRDLPVRLLVSHESGDEGDEYLETLRTMARERDVQLDLVHGEIGAQAPEGEGRSALDGLRDAYALADLVTYPSLYEGFGNALLEAFHYRCPVLVNRYAVFVADIEPKGFDVVAMDGHVTSRVVEDVRGLLDDDARRDAMTSHNRELARTHYGLPVLRRKLEALLAGPGSY